MRSATRAASTAIEEKVSNGGFESGEFAPWKGSGGCAVESNPSLAHGGRYCAKISGSKGGLTQVIGGLNPNTTYTLVGYVRLQNAGEHVFVGVRDHGGAPVSGVSNATYYAKVALKFVTGPRNTRATIFFTKDIGAGEALGDDFSVVEGLNDVDVIDSWLFAQGCWNARDRRLLEILRPDVVHRAGMYWVGTDLMDRDYEGARASLAKLRDAGSKNSRILGAGASGLYWQPDIETLGPGVDKEKATESPRPRKREIDYLAGRGYLTRDAENQLIYKAMRQIDAGFFDIEFDELCPSEYVVTALHDYARRRYGRKVFIVANPINLAWGEVDYYMVRFFAFKDAEGNFDGRTNPALAEKNCWVPGEKDLPYFWFVDFPGINWIAASSGQYPHALRLINAWTLANGNHRPSWSRTFRNRSDPLIPGNVNSGVFSIDANMVKFLKENGVLWHHLKAASPATFSVGGAGKVWKTAFTQPLRTIVHLVNGNYDNRTHRMPPRSGLTLRVSLDAAPRSIWMTTPDRLATSRRQTLSYKYVKGVATVAIPELHFHDIILIEQGPANTWYTPVYEPMRVVFPFPLQNRLPVGNSTHVTAIQTEGSSQLFDWSVNGIPGGNRKVGTISADGDYTAPKAPPRGKVTIKATSKDDPAVSNAFRLSVVKALSLPWKAEALDDWEIVDGQGDWETVLDASRKVIHNSNLMDGMMEYRSEDDFSEYSGSNAMIVGGDQNWGDYVYCAEFKPVTNPMTWYSKRNDYRYGVLFVFRHRDHDNYYWYQLCVDGKARLYRNLGGIKTQVGTGVACRFPVVGRYARVRVTAQGGAFTLEVNGKTVRTDREGSFLSGGVGLGTSFTENYFKRVLVGEIGK